jgi:undecaprenyl-diphosphatase
MEYLLSVIMGIVEGLTEFLPVSSTGHLILVGHFSGFENLVGKDMADAYEIIIQLGAILAVVAAYPKRFWGLLDFKQEKGLAGLRGIGLLVITSIPAGLVGFATHKLIRQRLFNPLTVALALTVGSLWILAVELWWRPRAKVEGVDSFTWREALKIGLFQCFSLWPGMSRSASTILGGMMSGVDRKTATEYSFFAAVPIMIAATCFECFKKRAYFHGAHVVTFAIGFIVSFIFAWIAVKVFIRIVSHHSLVPFAWYRLAVAATVFGVLAYYWHQGIQWVIQ